MQDNLILSLVGSIVAVLLSILAVFFIEKGKQVITPIAHTFKARGQQVIHQAAQIT